MTARTPDYLKGRFEQGDIPVGTDYEDLMDSYVNVETSAEQTIDSNLRTTKKLIALTVSAQNLNISNINVTGSASYTSLQVDTLTASAASITRVSAASIYATNASFSSVRATHVSASRINGAAANIIIVSADEIYVSGQVIFGTGDYSALSTTQASAVILNNTTNFIIFADGNNTALKLPVSRRGRRQAVINAASTTLKLYPSTSGRFLVTAVNAPLNIPADKTAMVFHKGDDRYGIVIGGF